MNLAEHGVQLAVFDMAGTTVSEAGVVYRTLAESLRRAGLDVTDGDIDPWHGANKIEVVRHFIIESGGDEDRVGQVFADFEQHLRDAYFRDDSPLAPIDGAIECFRRLRTAGIRVALNTGYPRDLCDALISRCGFSSEIDGSITSEEAGAGRPYPYMIHALLKHFRLAEVRKVAKIGDTVRDIEEGRNAGCGIVLGVQTGADGEEALLAAGADAVLPNVLGVRP